MNKIPAVNAAFKGNLVLDIQNKDINKIKQLFEDTNWTIENDKERFIYLLPENNPKWWFKWRKVEAPEDTVYFAVDKNKSIGNIFIFSPSQHKLYIYHWTT